MLNSSCLVAPVPPRKYTSPSVDELISILAPGELVPMPTLPELSMRIRSVPLIPNFTSDPLTNIGVFADCAKFTASSTVPR